MGGILQGDLIHKGGLWLPPPPPLLDLGRDGTFARASKTWWTSDNDLQVREFDDDTIAQPLRDRFAFGGPLTNAVEDDPADVSTVGGWALVDASGSAASEAGVAIAPDGTMRAARITFGTSANDRLQATTATPPALTLTQEGIWLWTESGTKEVLLEFFDGVTLFPDPGGAITVTTTPTRYEFLFTSSAAPTNGFFRIRNGDANAGSFLAFGALVQDDVPNLHPGPVLLPSATVALDDLRFANASLPTGILDTTGFWFYLWLNYSDVEWDARSLDGRFIHFSGTNHVQISTTGRFRYRTTAALANAGAATWSPDQRLIVVVDHENRQMRLGGLTTGNQTVDIAAAGDWGGVGFDLVVGSSGIGSSCWGDMSNLKPLHTAPI